VRKRKTEVDGQLGVLARKGESLGVAMPLTRASPESSETSKRAAAGWTGRISNRSWR
jgi:hypothetical protein